MPKNDDSRRAKSSPIYLSNASYARLLIDTLSEDALEAEIASIASDKTQSPGLIWEIRAEQQRRLGRALLRSRTEAVCGWAAAHNWPRILPRITDSRTGLERPWQFDAIGPGQEAWERIVFEAQPEVLGLIWAYLVREGANESACPAPSVPLAEAGSAESSSRDPGARVKGSSIGRPKYRRTGMADPATWKEKARDLRRMTRHENVTMSGAIARLELKLSDRQGREWLNDIDALEPEPDFPAE